MREMTEETGERDSPDWMDRERRENGGKEMGSKRDQEQCRLAESSQRVDAWAASQIASYSLYP